MATQPTETLRVTRLVESNYRRILSADISPGNRTLIVLQGPNEAGKTSILDGLVATLAGGKAQADMPVHAEHASVELELSDALRTRYRITRSWKGGKTWLNVAEVAADGEASKVSSPQTLLDSLVSTLSFNPLEFARAARGNTAADRQTTARMLFAAIGRPEVPDQAAARKAAIAEERRGINAQIKQIEAAIGADPAPGQNLEPVTDEQLKAQMQQAEQHNEARRSQERVIDVHNENAARAEAAARRCRDEAAKLLQQAKDAEEAATQHATSRQKAEQQLAAMPPAIGTDQIAAGLRQIREHNAKADRQRQYRDRVAALEAKARASSACSAQLDALDRRLQEILAASDLGQAVPGLAFADGALTHNAVPFSQASGMRQLELSTLVGMAANKPLRIMGIDEGDQLDDASLKRLTELAKEREYSIWMTAIRAGDETDPDTHLVPVADGRAASVTRDQAVAAVASAAHTSQMLAATVPFNPNDL